jgi:hypothetical protein
MSQSRCFCIRLESLQTLAPPTNCYLGLMANVHGWTILFPFKNPCLYPPNPDGSVQEGEHVEPDRTARLLALVGEEFSELD